MKVIGIPKEIMKGENRVAAVPETVEKFTNMGFWVMVEKNAGQGIFRDDPEYKKAGATVVEDAESLYGNADIILKVKQPLYNEDRRKHEIGMMKKMSFLITFLHPAAPSNHGLLKMLTARRITSFTMDGIPRISRAQSMDALTSMSTVTGYKSVLIAAGHLPKMVPMLATSTGTLKPAHFLVIGIGVVGLQALATAKRLGGVLTAVDIRTEGRNAARSLGAKIGGFEVPEELAIGKWGYAKALPEEWLRRERETLTPLLEEADAVILSALVPGETAPHLITAEMVSRMKPGTVIIDVSIDQGGNCALTHPGKEIVKEGVVISGLQNILGQVPAHATWLYANNVFQYVKNLFKKSLEEPDWEDEIVRSSLVTHEGKIVYEGAVKALNYPV